jgi:hypothetical protein
MRCPVHESSTYHTMWPREVCRADGATCRRSCISAVPPKRLHFPACICSENGCTSLEISTGEHPGREIVQNCWQFVPSSHGDHDMCDSTELPSSLKLLDQLRSPGSQLRAQLCVAVSTISRRIAKEQQRALTQVRRCLPKRTRLSGAVFLSAGPALSLQSSVGCK